VPDLAWLLAAALRAEPRELGMLLVAAAASLQARLGLTSRTDWKPADAAVAIRAALASGTSEGLATDLAWLLTGTDRLNPAHLSPAASRALFDVTAGLRLTSGMTPETAIRAALGACHGQETPATAGLTTEATAAALPATRKASGWRLVDGQESVMVHYAAAGAGEADRKSAALAGRSSSAPRAGSSPGRASRRGRGCS
jgi:hypothetical protein